MKSLRTRFAIGFCILYSVFMGTAFLIIYLSYADFREDEFYNRLKERGITTFKLLIEVERVDRELLAEINRNTLNSLYDEKVLIFENDSLIYSSIDDKMITWNRNLLARAKKEKEFRAVQDDSELIGIYFKQNKNDYTIFALAYDRAGLRKLVFLKWILLVVNSAGLLIGWLATWLFTRRILLPLEQLTRSMQNISPGNMNLRLSEANKSAEVNMLATGFNALMERLNRSFAFQKDFVNYMFHEIKTPLTAMVSLTENTLAEKVNNDALLETVKRLYKHEKNLASITNSLVVLSKAGGGSKHHFPLVRLDELLMYSADIMKDQFPEATISIDINSAGTQENVLELPADEPLLLMAFNNLLKNAIIYSPDHVVTVEIMLVGKQTVIEFRNHGPALSPGEEVRIFDPFYRGINSLNKNGYGLGLALVLQIADLHHANIRYTRLDDTNIFKLIFA